MGWSTREIAELAGTSLRSVRHYHQVGLLPEPERHSNGYKQYGVAHLVRLLRIKRLVDLGFSLARIAELGDADEHPEEALRALDADLEAQIERLQRSRAEVAEILRQGVPTDLPPEFAVARRAPMSEADRSIVSVLGRLLDARDRAIYAELLGVERTEADQDFDDLPDDADVDARADLARRLFDGWRLLRERHPAMATLGTSSEIEARHYGRTIGRAMVDVYNSAQVDVLQRLGAHIQAADP